MPGFIERHMIAKSSHSFLFTGLLALGLVALTPLAAAQENAAPDEPQARHQHMKMMKDPAARAARMTEHIAEIAGLSDQQRAQVAAINEKFATGLQARMKANRDQAKSMREEMKSLRDEQKAALREVLSDEQYIKVLEAGMERGHKRGKNMRKRMMKRQHRGEGDRGK